MLSASGGLRPPKPPTRGSALDPAGGRGLCPQIPVIGSRYRSRHVSHQTEIQNPPPPLQIPGSAAAWSRVPPSRCVGVNGTCWTQSKLWKRSSSRAASASPHSQHEYYKNSSEDEIANVNFLRRYGTYVLQNTKKENLLRLTN